MTVTPTAPPEPRACTRCNGAGTIEQCTFGIGLHEVRCPGENDTYDCDGIVR